MSDIALTLLRRTATVVHQARCTSVATNLTSCGRAPSRAGAHVVV